MDAVKLAVIELQPGTASITAGEQPALLAVPCQPGQCQRFIFNGHVKEQAGALAASGTATPAVIRENVESMAGAIDAIVQNPCCVRVDILHSAIGDWCRAASGATILPYRR